MDVIVSQKVLIYLVLLKLYRYNDIPYKILIGMNPFYFAAFNLNGLFDLQRTQQQKCNEVQN